MVQPTCPYQAKSGQVMLEAQKRPTSPGSPPPLMRQKDTPNDDVIPEDAFHGSKKMHRQKPHQQHVLVERMSNAQGTTMKQCNQLLQQQVLVEMAANCTNNQHQPVNVLPMHFLPLSPMHGPVAIPTHVQVMPSPMLLHGCHSNPMATVIRVQTVPPFVHPPDVVHALGQKHIPLTTLPCTHAGGDEERRKTDNTPDKHVDLPLPQRWHNYSPRWPCFSAANTSNTPSAISTARGQSFLTTRLPMVTVTAPTGSIPRQRANSSSSSYGSTDSACTESISPISESDQFSSYHCDDSDCETSKIFNLATSLPKQLFVSHACRESFPAESCLRLQQQTAHDKDQSNHRRECSSREHLAQHAHRDDIGKKSSANKTFRAFFKCKTCDQTCPSAAALEVHHRRHTGERPFTCNTCGKSFIRSYQLKMHHRTHTGVKPHRCELCNKAFTQYKYLKEHCQRHAKALPYVCRVCEKRFLRPSHLRKHAAVHCSNKTTSLD